LVDPNTRQGKRTPVTLKIKFKSETLEQFIERYAVDVSQGGIFIRTKEPLAVGTQMKFEFQLRDASPLIAGEGTVVWTRENDPSRPAIAPGMGVRFDRLADGSQGILERILTEKAKQAPQRPVADTAKPPLFTDTPTRVAPAPMQEALLGKDHGRGRRGDDASHLDSHTPLPRPMPFHSDADEFPDEAFEEATKVRALDELIAQTAEGDGKGDHPSRGRHNGRGDGGRGDGGRGDGGRGDAGRHDAGRGDGDPSSDRPELRPTVLPMHADHEVPDLPNPPDLARPQPRMLDTSPSPRFDSPPPAMPESLAKTRLGVEPARARVAPSTPPPPIGSVLSELPPLPSGMHAVAAEETAPARMPQLRSRSLAPLVILIFLIVAAGGAAVWFFVLRPQVSESHGTARQPDGSGSAAAVTTTGSGGSAAAAATGSGTGTGSAAGVAAATGSAAKGELVDTPITASVDGASVEITGTDQAGPAPFTARLEKGKPYKARITARGFAALELDIKGGDPKLTAKLVAKPRLVVVTSDPSGAQISVDGTATGHSTPFDFELTAAQAAKKSVHVVIRKSGFRAVDRTLDITKFTEDDTRMTAKLDEKLSPAPAVTTRPTGSGTGSAKPAGSDGAGSDATAAPSGGSAQAPGDGPVTSPTPTPPPATPPSGAGSGSAEPEPDFNKPK